MRDVWYVKWIAPLSLVYMSTNCFGICERVRNDKKKAHVIKDQREQGAAADAHKEAHKNILQLKLDTPAYLFFCKGRRSYNALHELGRQVATDGFLPQVLAR